MKHDSYGHYPEYEARDHADDPDVVVIDDPDAQVKERRERELEEVESTAQECARAERDGRWLYAQLLDSIGSALDGPGFTQAYEHAVRQGR